MCYWQVLFNCKPTVLSVWPRVFQFRGLSMTTTRGRWLERELRSWFESNKNRQDGWEAVRWNRSAWSYILRMCTFWENARCISAENILPRRFGYLVWSVLQENPTGRCVLETCSGRDDVLQQADGLYFGVLLVSKNVCDIKQINSLLFSGRFVSPTYSCGRLICMIWNPCFSAWFETWWQMLHNMSSKRTAFVIFLNTESNVGLQLLDANRKFSQHHRCHVSKLCVCICFNLASVCNASQVLAGDECQRKCIPTMSYSTVARSSDWLRYLLLRLETRLSP